MEAIHRSAVNSKEENQMSGDEDSKNSSSQSSNGESKSNSGSDNEANDEEGTVKLVGASKKVQRLGSSNAGEANDDRVQKPAQKSTKDVSKKELNADEKGKSLENTTKEVRKTASTLTQNGQSLKNTTKVAEKAPTKEVRLKRHCYEVCGLILARWISYDPAGGCSMINVRVFFKCNRRTGLIHGIPRRLPYLRLLGRYKDVNFYSEY